MTSDGAYTVISSGFHAYGEHDKSEGRGGRIGLGRFTEVEEAVAAAKGQGIQGDSGYVAAFEYRLYEGGLVEERSIEVWGRRKTPRGLYEVGWKDYGEYAEAFVPATPY